MTDTVQVPREAIEINYTNWRGERFTRNIIPLRLEFGSNEWHPVPQWLIIADDCDKGEERAFALAGFAVAPQATDPRERHILITPDRSHVEVRDMDHAMTLLAEQNMAIDTLTERLTRERDEALDRALECESAKWSVEAHSAALAEIERLREALEYYASNRAWTVSELEGPYGDYGKRARAALSPPPLSPEPAHD